MKTYVLDVRYYIQAENENELQEELRNIGISNSEYYNGYEIVSVEDEEE